MRIYEELFIVKPDATDEEVDQVTEQLTSVVTTSKGTVDKVDKWGKRRLAYRVQKYKEGFYVLVQFSAEPDTVKEVERRLRVNDAVIKYLTVRIDETLKRVDKRKKQREKRALRKPPPAQAAPSPMPQPAMPPSPAVPAIPAMPAAPAMPAVPAEPVADKEE